MRLLNSEGEPHRRHRKLLAPAFAPRRIASYGEIMIHETREQLARWSPGDRIDLADEMMQMTLAIAGRTLFGVDVRRDASTVAHALELAMRSMTGNITSPIRLGYRWPLPRHLRMRRAVKLLDDVVYRLIAEGRTLGTDRGDVLSMLLLARDEDHGTALTDREVRDEVMTLLLAGHETTANTLTWTWYELGRNPDVLARLAAEIQRVAGTRPITTDDLPALPWTAAVIDEAMRLHPPAYVTGREALCDVELAGHRLPEKSIVLVNIRGIHPGRLLPDPAGVPPRAHARRRQEGTVPPPLPAVRRRPARLHRRPLRADRGTARPRHHGATREAPPAQVSRHRRAARHPAPARRHAGARRALLVARPQHQVGSQIATLRAVQPLRPVNAQHAASCCMGSSVAA